MLFLPKVRPPGIDATVRPIDMRQRAVCFHQGSPPGLMARDPESPDQFPPWAANAADQRASAVITVIIGTIEILPEAVEDRPDLAAIAGLVAEAAARDAIFDVAPAGVRARPATTRRRRRQCPAHRYRALCCARRWAAASRRLQPRRRQERSRPPHFSVVVRRDRVCRAQFRVFVRTCYLTPE
jgi:hypothetical protein